MKRVWLLALLLASCNSPPAQAPRFGAGFGGRRPLPTPAGVATQIVAGGVLMDLDGIADGQTVRRVGEALVGADKVVPSAHATTHETGGTDAVTLAQSQVTGLVTSLASKVASVSSGAGVSCTGTSAVTCAIEIPVTRAHGGTEATTALGARGSLACAPNDATYIVKTANAEIGSAQPLSALATGLVKVTNGSGDLSAAAAGVDYQAALSLPLSVANGGTGASALSLPGMRWSGQATGAVGATANYLADAGAIAAAPLLLTAQTYPVQAGTYKNLRINALSNALGSTLTCTVQKNGSDTTITVPISAAATGVMVDTTHSASFAASDTIDLKCSASGAGVAVAVLSATIGYAP